jgi:hypothetical protein
MAIATSGSSLTGVLILLLTNSLLDMIILLTDYYLDSQIIA